LLPRAALARFIKRQVRDNLSQPFDLFREMLEFLELVSPYPAILPAPAIIGLLSNANLSDRVQPRHTFRNKHSSGLYRFIAIVALRSVGHDQVIRNDCSPNRSPARSLGFFIRTLHLFDS
jgi:hypothetical protein